jgi:hypothetical protein
VLFLGGINTQLVFHALFFNPVEIETLGMMTKHIRNSLPFSSACSLSSTLYLVAERIYKKRLMDLMELLALRFAWTANVAFRI